MTIGYVAVIGVGGNPESFRVTIALYIAAVPGVGVPLIKILPNSLDTASPGGSEDAVQL
jgi:hypothetical protein